MVFQCEVEDGSGIAAVTWLLDGRSVLESRQAPYSLVWQPKPGQYTLELRAADLAGNISEAERVRFEVVP
jgi:hypothetical protein